LFLKEEILLKTKPFIIDKKLVLQAYRSVKAKAGSEGIDHQTLADFNKDWRNNLYKIWNRLSSGSYMPPAIKGVSIPKKQGGERVLGIPTVSDRIAQTVVKFMFEQTVEPYFLPDSYGYRPNKSALEAVGVTRQRCWKYNYVVEFDIKGLFDHLDHERLMKAVEKHTDNKWVILYIKRWLKAPLQLADGTCVNRVFGVPQGGCISPILSNLYLHYAFDVWMKNHYPETPWCRYADDGLVHCKNEQEARKILSALKKRMEACGLELHENKTKIIYCSDDTRKKEYCGTEIKTSFEFLGYSFCKRKSYNSWTKRMMMNFGPGVSRSSQKEMRSKIRALGFRRRTGLSLKEIAQISNPILQGWIEYYGRYNRWALGPVMRHFNLSLVAWAMSKYKKLKTNKTAASKLMIKIAKREPGLFVHWKKGMVSTFV
jgi:RNA-directed DNA polymerase